MQSYKEEIIQELAKDIQSKGYRVFIAESGTYGFYTDSKRVVCFQSDLGGIVFSGNYISSKSGTGWGLETNTYKHMIESYAPGWITNHDKITMITLEQHLDRYQKSSKYKELN